MEPAGENERNPTRGGVFHGASEPWIVYAMLVLFALFLWAGNSLEAPRVAADAADAVSPGASLGPAHVVTRDARPVVLLAREQRGACVDVRTDCDLDLAEYAAIADRVLPRLREWFGPGWDRHSPPARYTVYLCSSVERMFEVERLCGESISVIPGHRVPYPGLFYPRSKSVVMLPGTARDTAWLLVHELTHAAFFERVGRDADPINEGLAELLPDWLLYSKLERPEEHLSTYARYQSRCARAMLERGSTSLPWLCSLNYTAFRDDRIEELGYAASWALMKTIVESRDPAITGRVQALLSDLAHGSSVQDALDGVYGLARIESVWRGRMRSWTEWEPCWGTWRDEGRDWSTTLATWGSHLLLAHDPPGNSAFELGFTWHTPSTEYVGLGFALGMRDEENVALLSLIESEQRVMLEVYRGGELEREYSWPLPRDLEFDCKSIVLTCAPGARVALGIGDFSMPLEGVDAATIDGRCGLIAERLAYAPRRVVTQLTFQDPWNRTGPARGEPEAARLGR